MGYVLIACIPHHEGEKPDLSCGSGSKSGKKKPVYENITFHNTSMAYKKRRKNEKGWYISGVKDDCRL
jgi:hypothetical protein